MLKKICISIEHLYGDVIMGFVQLFSKYDLFEPIANIHLQIFNEIFVFVLYIDLLQDLCEIAKWFTFTSLE